MVKTLSLEDQLIAAASIGNAADIETLLVNHPHLIDHFKQSDDSVIQGQSALSIAVSRGHTEAALMLLQHNASLTPPSDRIYTAYERHYSSITDMAARRDFVNISVFKLILARSVINDHLVASVLNTRCKNYNERILALFMECLVRGDLLHANQTLQKAGGFYQLPFSRINIDRLLQRHIHEIHLTHLEKEGAYYAILGLVNANQLTIEDAITLQGQLLPNQQQVKELETENRRLREQVRTLRASINQEYSSSFFSNCSVL